MRSVLPCPGTRFSKVVRVSQILLQYLGNGEVFSHQTPQLFCFFFLVNRFKAQPIKTSGLEVS